MKSQSRQLKPQARLLARPAGPNRSAILQLAALGLAAVVLVAAPLRSHAHEVHGALHAQVHAQAVRGYGHAAGAHALRADWHGGGGFHASPGFHAVGPGNHGAYAAGWHGGGRWEHGWHGGNYGWWYIDAGIWTAYPWGYPYGYYPYAAYPPYAYVAPEASVTYNNLPPQQQTWYYCDAARAYYPAVQSCPAGWRPVPAAPPPGAAPAAPH
jgi:hypothetical protein